jgi:Flp pilus assembly protein TadG
MALSACVILHLHRVSSRVRNHDLVWKMTLARTTRRRVRSCGMLRESRGQSLVEIALILPILLLMMAYAVDFAYFFVASATITSSARNATQYSVLGYQGPAQSGIPASGPASNSMSVTALALADLGALVNASTSTTVQVCSKNLGMNGTTNRPNCTIYGSGGGTTAYTPALDPEAPRYVLQRVDVTYTVQPPVPMRFFGVSLLPSMQFHRSVSMRAMD